MSFGATNSSLLSFRRSFGDIVGHREDLAGLLVE
jgi:hypothetical protein